MDTENEVVMHCISWLLWQISTDLLSMQTKQKKKVTTFYLN